jgi:hypothetical protein
MRPSLRVRGIPNLDCSQRICAKSCQMVPPQLLSLNQGRIENRKPRGSIPVAFAFVTPLFGSLYGQVLYLDDFSYRERP